MERETRRQKEQNLETRIEDLEEKKDAGEKEAIVHLGAGFHGSENIDTVIADLKKYYEKMKDQDHVNALRQNENLDDLEREVEEQTSKLEELKKLLADYRSKLNI